MNSLSSFWSALLDRLNIPETDWVEILLIIGLSAAAFVLAWTAHVILFRLLMKQLSEKTRDALVGTLRRPTRLAVLLAAAFAVAPLWPFDSNDVPVYAILGFTLVLTVGWVAIAIVNAWAALLLSQTSLDTEDNLAARKQYTQVRVLRQVADIVLGTITIGAALFTIPAVRSFGVSLFASAGVAGLVIGIAARPVLANLIAGFQIAITQPIRIEDAVIVENEWGWIEEINATYVVVRLWDWRRLIVPLSHFVEKPFQNWTRESGRIIGSVFWHVDHRAPLDAMRKHLTKMLEGTDLWDGEVNVLQVTDTSSTTVIVRALMSARTSPVAWDLRCLVREGMISWLQAHHPSALPRVRAEVDELRPDSTRLPS